MDQNSSDPDSNELTSGTSGTSPTLKVNDPPELCSICLEVVIMLDVQTFKICTGCGNYMHEICSKTNHAGKSTSYLEEEEIKKLISSSDCLMCHSEEAQPGSEEEIKRLRVWCSKKKPWAQEMLADRYSQGIGVSQDYERAFVLWKLAADQGFPVAQSNLDCLYGLGRGCGSIEVSQSDSLAIKFWKLSAAQGYAPAQFHSGNCYANGKGVEIDDVRAVQYY